MESLQGRRVLVTGASSGIGDATARALAAQGAVVACLARRRDRVRTLATELDGHAVSCDVADPDAAATGVDQAAAALGGLDAIINNAGVFRLGTVAAGSVADWRAMLEVNVLGLLAATQAAIGHLRAAGGGDVVLMSSLSGRRVPRETATVYAATKHAVHAIGEGLRKELHDDGIRVTTVAPGIVDTGLVAEQAQHDEDVAAFHARMGDLGLDPDAVARAVARALAEPPEVATVELALAPTAQRL